MKARILTICLGVTLVAGGYMWGNHSATTVHAQDAVSIPKAWGKIIGTPSGGLVFEDSTGTVRITDMYGRPQVVITRN